MTDLSRFLKCKNHCYSKNYSERKAKKFEGSSSEGIQNYKGITKLLLGKFENKELVERVLCAERQKILKFLNQTLELRKFFSILDRICPRLVVT